MLETAKSRRRAACTPSLAFCRAIAVLLCPSLAVSGCVGRGLEAAAPAAPDTGMITGSIAPSASGDTAEREAVRGAVASATAMGNVAIPWADPTTGTVGVITSLAETKTPAGACRSFETTRHGYEGVVLYVGRACKIGDGPWRLTEFRPKHAMAEAAGAG